jgi:hypothetical protein
MDTGIAQLYSVVDEVFVFVRNPCRSMEIGEVERTLLAMLMGVGREALTSYLDEKGTWLSTRGDGQRTGRDITVCA